jgi:hypothetical protein
MEHYHIIQLTVTDGYYRSGYNREPTITQAVNVEHRTNPNLMYCLNPPEGKFFV